MKFGMSKAEEMLGTEGAKCLPLKWLPATFFRQMPLHFDFLFLNVHQIPWKRVFEGAKSHDFDFSRR